MDANLKKVAIALMNHLGTPRALSVVILLRYGEWSALGELRADPALYLDVCNGIEKFRRDNQASEFLRKSPLLPPNGDLVENAIAAFYECEKQCAETNYFLKHLEHRRNSAGITRTEDALIQILDKARKIATRVLGKVPVGSFQGRFGPGTSFELKGSLYTTVCDKMYTTPMATPLAMYRFESDMLSTLWGKTREAEDLPFPEYIRGNRFTTVPKDATKHRGICIEPLGNLWVQLGIGGYLKRRLAGVGLKVGRTSQPLCPIKRLQSSPSQDGKSFHNDLAREGSITGRWATIDLSNASDTVSLELVRWVIPPSWFTELYATRSPYTLIKGVWHKLDKFSSMGNGFTFELETLVFACLVSAATGCTIGEDVFVYGDDIIVPEADSREAMAILMAAGFTPNMRKSYTAGPFKESCGGDFFDGRDVRAVYATSQMSSPLDWMGLHNRIREKWPFAGPALHRCVAPVPLKLRLFGPECIAAGVFHSRKYRVYRTKRGWQVVMTVIPTLPRLSLNRWSEQLYYALYVSGYVRGGSPRTPFGVVMPRGEPVGYRIRFMSV